MSSPTEGKPIQRENGDQRKRLPNGKTPPQPGSYASDREVVYERSETKRIKRSDEDRQIEIRDHVFSLCLPGVEITHCNFGKTQVEVWYVTKETDSDRFEKELQKQIGSRVDPYKLKLVKKAGHPNFKYTSPGQGTSLMRRDGSIGAYVTLTDGNGGASTLHALVCGHGKKPGDVLYSDLNAGQRIGEVKVAKEGKTEPPSYNSYDVGLVRLDEQRVDQHETWVTMNGERLQLDRTTAALNPGVVIEDQQVMFFNNGNIKSNVLHLTYNSKIPRMFGMIGIKQPLSEDMQAVHEMNDSGTLVAALSPYQENGERCVKAVGMLVGIEENILLAVPIGRNLQALMQDRYCANKGIEFA